MSIYTTASRPRESVDTGSRKSDMRQQEQAGRDASRKLNELLKRVNEDIEKHATSKPGRRLSRRG